MYVDIPILTRCCLCLPLRRGILAFAYINLVISLLICGGLGYMYSLGNTGSKTIYRGNIYHTDVILLIILALLDVISSIVLIIAGHMKSILLYKIYFYYGISTTIAGIVLNFTLMGTSWLFFEEIFTLFVGVAINVYVLILVRSEYLKLETSQPVHYINQLSSIIVSNDQCDQVYLIPSAKNKLAA